MLNEPVGSKSFQFFEGTCPDYLGSKTSKILPWIRITSESCHPEPATPPAHGSIRKQGKGGMIPGFTKKWGHGGLGVTWGHKCGHRPYGTLYPKLYTIEERRFIP